MFVTVNTKIGSYKKIRSTGQSGKGETPMTNSPVFLLQLSALIVVLVLMGQTVGGAF